MKETRFLENIRIFNIESNYINSTYRRQITSHPKQQSSPYMSKIFDIFRGKYFRQLNVRGRFLKRKKIYYETYCGLSAAVCRGLKRKTEEMTRKKVIWEKCLVIMVKYYKTWWLKLVTYKSHNLGR